MLVGCTIPTIGSVNLNGSPLAAGAIPAASNVRYGVSVGSTTGTCRVPGKADVKAGVAVDVSDTGEFTHTTDYVAKTDVVSVSHIETGYYNWTGGTEGTVNLASLTAAAAESQLEDDQEAVLAAAAAILEGTTVLGQAGTLDADKVLTAVGGTYVPVLENRVSSGTEYGPSGSLTGTLSSEGGSGSSGGIYGML
jgi:hypothetical protein